MEQPEHKPEVALPDMLSVFQVRSVDGVPFTFESMPLARALRGEIVQDVEFAYTSLFMQSERTISVSAAPLRENEQGIINGAVIVTRDLTLLRQAEQQAAERAQQLEAIFEAMTEAVFIFQPFDRSPKFNRASRDMLGFSEDLTPRQFKVFTEEGVPLPYEYCLMKESNKASLYMEIPHRISFCIHIMDSNGSSQ